MSNQVNSTKIVTGKVRFCYVNVFEPTAMNEGDTPKYNICILIPKSDTATIDKIKKAIEAAKEAARQIRLRNLSGIIMIDFIDMRSKEDEKELLQVMQHYLNDDSKKAVAVDITKLGIMEITRKKEKNPIFRQISIDILE